MKKCKKMIIFIILLLITMVFSTHPYSFCNSDEIMVEENYRVATTIDGVINDARDFIDIPGDNVIDDGLLKETTNFLYNLLLGIGIIVAVIVGIVLGIKYMIGSVEEKAEYKQSLVIYVIGCVVLFSAFGIWALIVDTVHKFFP